MYKLFLNRYSQLLALTACTSSLGFVMVGRKYIDRYRIYNAALVEDGKPLFCDDYIHQLLMEVGLKMGISEEELKRIIIYHTKFDSPIYKGCLKSPVESWLPKALIPNPGIGLPRNFVHVYLDDTSYVNLKINGKPLEVESDSAEGVHFRRQMVLSEDAKKFVLARELYYLKSNIDLIRECVSVAAVYAFYQVIFALKRTFVTLNDLKLPGKIPLYSGIGVCVYFLQRELMEAYSLGLHYKADKVASHADQRMHAGAMEYYEKLIKRNKFFHQVGFKKEFNKLGNEVSGIIFNYSVTNSHMRLSRLMDPKSVT